MSLETFIINLIHASEKPALPSEVKRKALILTFFCTIAIITLFFFFMESLNSGNTGHGYILLATLGLTVSTVFSFRIHGSYTLFSFSVVVLIGAFCIYLVLSQGMEKNSTVWCLIVPIFSFYVLGYRAGLICNCILAIIFGILLFLPSTPFFHVVYTFQFAIRFIFSYFFITLMSFALEYSRKRAQDERDRTIEKLREALASVKTLSGLLPICACCKKIRNDKGYWEDVEKYIEDYSEATFSHGLCAICAEELYGNQEWYKRSKEKRNGKG